MEKFFGNRLSPSIWSKVKQSSGVLLIGCEGGYSIINALPIYFSIKSLSVPVFLCNMSLASLKNSTAEILLRDSNISQSPILYRVTSSTDFTSGGTKPKEFFPEKYLCEWFTSINQHLSIYCTERTGPKNLSECYKAICESNNLSLIIIVDHGSDSLMSGCEGEIGGYVEDMLTIYGADQIGIECVLCNVVVGYDRHLGVSDCSTFRAIAEITEQGGFLGNFALQIEMAEVQLYLQAWEYVQERMPRLNFPAMFLKNALLGNFGHVEIFPDQKKTFVNPCMTQVFFFNLKTVVGRILYREYVEGVKTAAELMNGIEYYRKELEEKVSEEMVRTKEF